MNQALGSVGLTPRSSTVTLKRGNATPGQPQLARDFAVFEERMQDLEDISAHLNNEMLLHKKQIELQHAGLYRYVDSKGEHIR